MSLKFTSKNTLKRIFSRISEIFIKKSDIVDNLTSSDTDKPLSAKQGKVLSENKVGFNILDNGNANDIITTGIYWLNLWGGTSTWSNLPEYLGGIGTLIVNGYNGSINQTYMNPHSGGKTFQRTYFDGAWHDWVCVTDSIQSQLNTLSNNLNNNILPNGRATFYSASSWWNQLLNVNDDADNIKSCGMANTINGWAHLPNSEISYLDGWGTLVCFAPGTSNNDILQLWYGMNTNGRLFSRKYRDGRWTSWTEILFNQLPSNYIPNLDTSTILDYLIKVNKNMFNLCRESKHPGLYADNWLFTHWDDLGITMDTSQPHDWQTIYDTPGSVYNRVQKNRLEAYGANGSLVIPSVIGAIGSTTYANLANLTSIEIPDTVTTIGAYAFMGCSNATISIPSSVTSIGRDAFNGVAHIYYSGSATGAPWGAAAYN